MLADIVILSKDIFQSPSESLKDTAVTVTIFDGKVVYQQPIRPNRTSHEVCPPRSRMRRSVVNSSTTFIEHSMRAIATAPTTLGRQYPLSSTPVRIPSSSSSTTSSPIDTTILN